MYPFCNMWRISVYGFILLTFSSTFGSANHQFNSSVDSICNLENCTNYNSINHQSPEPINIYRPHNDNYLISSSIVYGIITYATITSNVNPTCRRHLQAIHDGIHRKEVWAMKVLDSSGTYQPGFIWGNNMWLGSIKGCKGVNNPFSLTLSNRFYRNMKPNLIYEHSPFDVDYRVAYAKHQSPWQVQVEFLLTEKILHFGICLPTSCTNDEISQLTQTYLNSGHLESQTIFEHQAEVVLVKDLNVKSNFLSLLSVQILGGFVILTIVMILLSMFLQNQNLELNNNVSINNNYISQGNSTGSGYEVKDIDCKHQELLLNESLMEKIIHCFSLSKNYSKIISTKTSPNAIPVIDGLKSISCFFVLIFHMTWYTYYTTSNPAMVFAYGEEVLWQWVTTSPLIVDIFFTISGLLLAYNFFNNPQKMYAIRNNSLWQNCKMFGKQLLHRYLRLSPLYLVVMGVTQIATAYVVETSPFWLQERCDETCNKYWWRNVLYIQNFFPVTELCMNWSWSLACEMQFFIVFTLFLFFYAKYPERAQKLFLLLFVVFCAVMLGVALNIKFTPAFDVLHDTGNSLYTSPFTRILPYQIGVGTGWLLYSLKGNISLSKNFIKVMWAITSTIVFMCHMSTVYRGLPYGIAAPLISAVRVGYSFSVAWMIFASAIGYGGSFSNILNFKGFVHINKLSYGIYLVNPILISVIYGLKDHSTHIDPISTSVMTAGVCVISYLVSFLFSLLFEVPYTNISNLIMKYNSNSKKLSTSCKKN